MALHTRSGGAQHLVGYFVPENGVSVNTADLSSYLNSKLPDYMVPTLWQELIELPVTGNGKLDRNRLPEPDQTAVVEQIKIKPPESDFEKQLAAIWCEVLSIEEVGLNSNLFSLGADSLHMFRIAARMKREDMGLDARHLLQYPTIGELSQLHKTQQTDKGEQATQAAPPSLSSFVRGSRLRRGIK